MVRGLHFQIHKDSIFGRFKKMSKQVIQYGHEKRLVREDAAKAFRGTYWALIVVAFFILVAALLFFGGFIRSWTGGSADKGPAQVEREAGR